MTAPRILSRHAFQGITIDRFLTRFGEVIWTLSTSDEPCFWQGTREDAKARLRELAT